MSSVFVKYDNTRPIVAYDTETELFGRGKMAPRIVCFSFAWRNENGQVRTELLDYQAGAQALHGLLDRCLAGEITIAGHNLPYDVLVCGEQDQSLLLKFFDCYEAGGVHCTMNAEQLIDIARGLLRVQWDEEKNEYTNKKSYGLENIAHLRLRWPFYKDEWRMRYAELRDIPISQWPEPAIVYPKRDAEATLLIAEDQRNDAARVAPHDPIVAMLSHVCRTYLALALTSAWGEEIDSERVAKMNECFLRYREEFIPELIKSKLVVQTMRGKNAGKITKKKKRLQELVAADLIERGVFDCTVEDILTRPMDVLDDDHLTDGGASGNRVLKCGSEILIDCVPLGPNGELSTLKRMSEFLDAEKLRNSFGTPLALFGNGPMHARYGLAETGRTTCSGGSKRARMGLNIQQLPRDLPKKLKLLMMELLGEIIDVRSCLVPREGWVQSSSDFSALEMCTWAQACLWLVGFSTLADALNDDVDPHTLFAANFFLHTDYDTALAQVTAKIEEAKDARQRAKVGNFGLPGGMGAKKFHKYAKKQGIVMSMKEAQYVKDSFPRQWAEAVPYFANTSAITANGEATIVGLSSGLVRGGCGYTDVNNGFFQEHAAAGATDALWVNVREMYDPRLNTALYGSRMTAFVHDEYRAEHPIEAQHEAATRLADNAREVMQRWVPDVKIKIEPALTDRWWKQAETVRDKHGRLQVWRPKAA